MCQVLVLVYLRKWQAGGDHRSLEHDEGIPAQDPILPVSWPVLPAGATSAERLPLVQVYVLSEAPLAAVQAQTYAQGQWTLPRLVA